MSVVFAAVDTASAVQIVLAVVGTSGVVGAVVALLKLKPEANSAAVTQAQGVMEMMASLNDELEAERDAWRARALGAEEEARALRVRLARRP